MLLQILDNFGRDESRDAKVGQMRVLANTPSDFSGRDNADQGLFLVDDNRIILWEVSMIEQLVVVVALAAENNHGHLVYYSLSLVPPVQRFDKVAPHNEAERVRLLVLLLELVHEVDGGDTIAVLDLDRIYLHWEVLGEEFLHGEFHHCQTVLWR
eukprot:CAMPEP_0170471932 /NCGR_PEP_ID=MMETSP0123-20130129/14060_1 /TAXON_ID=182087 /ORGANISM="Favella ehrenbergii, Strain Fehren 1" /LENGTH=154 /DNA_ID=CAMNT_0010739891 /DNA_START=301 /DNA_END=765 /DNA_ORIENTATION=+